MQIINGGPAVTQPWNEVLFPSAGAVPRGMNARIAAALPAAGRALSLIAGMASQMPLEKVRGWDVLPRPPILRRPDPTKSRSWFVGMHMWDFLLHGNAVHYITSRSPESGLPTSVMWLPAEQITISWDPDNPAEVAYWMGGYEIDRANIVHVQRGADPWCPHRGIGVVEQHLRALTKVDKQEDYEAGVLDGAAVPSVAVITPNPDLSQDEADAAKTTWIEKYGGTKREPGVFPSGTQVIPLSWSPSDSQLVEARQQSLTDMANMFNLDGYWLGAPASSHTYRTPGPMYLNLLRQTLNPILDQFEDVWGWWWLTGDDELRFQRRAVLGDDFATSVRTGRDAIRDGLMTTGEVRTTLLGLPAELPRDPNEREDDTSAEPMSPEAAIARDVVEMIQKGYLGVGKAVSAEELRKLLNRAGADLSEELPEDVAAYRPPTSLTPDDEPTDDEPTEEAAAS
ncbi:phage portal protein [uncultured Aeromicrobium sp.]|uniref:phage portal protein n=1 Tax=uncultured Aeromicrobium sp. TaxID=337820 RepID=UPI0025DC8981|nr:phage portal protein [uncultured Aeromicrobium sp.]